ncbi:unnamed protein product [Angiostrongylus costaricensis]|uniref:Cadherin_C domain-containing protein n=1 Tax=Angiostrongylus costaricensis TaxID=334426 RepID=A0A0R3Q2B0_ANGCS|nr:unnamed protein product [Angiostrongylus costaricensis]
MCSFIAALYLVALCSPWVIYRRSQKKKLICKEEMILTNNTILDYSSEDAFMNMSRRRRDIVLDPTNMEPVIFLGTNSNSSSYVDDGDFDIIADGLTQDEIAKVKQSIIDTCNSLKIT